MSTEHRARITWSPEQVHRGLPAIAHTVDPAWFPDGQPGKGDAWSLNCRFDPPPSVQGNPSTAYVRFLLDAAPAHRLQPGALLRLFERATQQLAIVEIID